MCKVKFQTLLWWKEMYNSKQFFKISFWLQILKIFTVEFWIQLLTNKSIVSNYNYVFDANYSTFPPLGGGRDERLGTLSPLERAGWGPNTRIKELWKSVAQHNGTFTKVQPPLNSFYCILMLAKLYMSHSLGILPWHYLQTFQKVIKFTFSLFRISV